MIKVTRLFDFPYYQLEKYGGLFRALTTKYGDAWVSISTQRYIDHVNAISRALIRLGVQPNDKIAVISSTNRTEWNIVDIAVLQIGAQNVPIYPSICKEEYEYILNHSEATYCFVSDVTILEKLNAIKNKTRIREVYTFDKVPHEKNWKKLLEIGSDESNQKEVEARMQAVKPNDLATLIYTSGTTGTPKGVMLSHQNIVSNVLASVPMVPLQKGKSKALSFLPVCHVFERMILYLYQYCGVEIHFAESIDAISDNLKEVQPNIITAVPRLYEKVYDKIIAKGQQLPFIKRSLFNWAVNLAMQYQPYNANGFWYRKKLKFANKLIFSKWREGLGGNLDLMVCGSAALQSRLTRIFAAAGIPIMEGYGLTETSPVVSVNCMENNGFRIGTVGKVIEGVEVKIARDGEILIKGPNVMLGYYKDPKKTAEVIQGGYFYTGDLGELSDDGFLKITGRKKELFKTSGGKYVVPGLLEERLKHSLFIEQVMVVGEGEKMPAAIIQPNFGYLRKWAKKNKIELSKDNAVVIKNPFVINTINEEVSKCNIHFGHWEQIKKFELTPDEWTVEGGHLTPTMKVKRKVIEQMYQKLYDQMYRS